MILCRKIILLNRKEIKTPAQKLWIAIFGEQAGRTRISISLEPAAIELFKEASYENCTEKINEASGGSTG